LLYAIHKAKQKYHFRLYGLCIMSNHVHYLIEPAAVDELPKIMHWLNWYTAMCFNQMLKRTGHFWEQRYHSSGFDKTDHQRALNTLRYIHANPRNAKMQRGFFYDFSNYGCYDQLTNDGITEWHPSFLQLGKTLEECAKTYRGFCYRHKTSSKRQSSRHWGRHRLGNLIGSSTTTRRRRSSPGQISIQHLEPWCQVSEPPGMKAIADAFIKANTPNAEPHIP